MPEGWHGLVRIMDRASKGNLFVRSILANYLRVVDVVVLTVPNLRAIQGCAVHRSVLAFALSDMMMRLKASYKQEEDDLPASLLQQQISRTHSSS